MKRSGAKSDYAQQSHDSTAFGLQMLCNAHAQQACDHAHALIAQPTAAEAAAAVELAAARTGPARGPIGEGAVHQSTDFQFYLKRPAGLKPCLLAMLCCLG